MFPPVSRRRPPRSTRSHSSKRANKPLLFGCLRTAQNYIWVLITLAVGSNLVIFLGGGGGVKLEAPTLRPQQNVAQRRWAYEIEEPPDGLTCENWLTDADRVQGGRDFSKDPITIFAKEPKLYHTCAVGCVLKEAQKGTFMAHPTSWHGAAYHNNQSLPSPRHPLRRRVGTWPTPPH